METFIDEGTGALMLNNIFGNKEIIDIQKYKKYLTVGDTSRPIMIICETVNICNNNCIVCANSKMSREKMWMTNKIFEKVLADYRNMGGGAFSLTPVIGDIFLDPLLLDRIESLKKYPTISPLSVTTNAVASDRFGGADLKVILDTLDLIHISIYGLDREEYFAFSRKDNYHRMVESLKNFLRVGISREKFKFGFRLLKKRTVEQIEQWIQENFGVSIEFAFTYQYSNWGILDTTTKLPYDAEWIEPIEIKSPCLIPLVACQVFANGDVSFCHCDDFNINEELRLGNVQDASLLAIYNSNKTKALWNFEKNIPDFCRNCSFYKPIVDIEKYGYIFDNPSEFIGG